MCRRDEHLWRIMCPLICIFVVEWHLPHRVATQFNARQRIPPDDVYTGGLALHQINRQKYNHIVDWTTKHHTYVSMWDDRENRKETDMVATNQSIIEAYLDWYDDGVKFRLRLRPRWTDEDMALIKEEDSSEDEYTRAVKHSQGRHREFAPVLSELGAQQDYFRWRTRTQIRPPINDFRRSVEGHDESNHETLPQAGRSSWVFQFKGRRCVCSTHVLPAWFFEPCRWYIEPCRRYFKPCCRV